MEIKFEVLDKFIEQKQAIEDGRKKLREREDAAREVYDARVAEYERAITQGVVEGKDTTSELDRLDAEVQKAKADLERRKKESQIFLAAPPFAKVSPEDVVKSFNTVVVPKFKEERLDTVLKRVLMAKKEYEQAVLDYELAFRQISNVREAACDELAIDYSIKLKHPYRQTGPEHVGYFLTANDLRDLKNGQPLQSLQHVGPEELN